MKRVNALFKKISLIYKLAFLAFFYCLIVLIFKLSPYLNVSYELRIFGDLLYNICISINAAFIFYLFQISLIERKRKKTVYPIIEKRIDRIVNSIKSAVYELGNCYLLNHKGIDYTDDELHIMMNKLNFEDVTKIKDIKSFPDLHGFRMRDWLISCAVNTENEIDKLYQNFGRDLPIEISDCIEQILYSKYHCIIIKYAKMNVKMTFSECKDEIIAEYWRFCKQLESSKIILK